MFFIDETPHWLLYFASQSRDRGLGMRSAFNLTQMLLYPRPWRYSSKIRLMIAARSELGGDEPHLIVFRAQKTLALRDDVTQVAGLWVVQLLLAPVVESDPGWRVARRPRPGQASAPVS